MWRRSSGPQTSSYPRSNAPARSWITRCRSWRRWRASGPSSRRTWEGFQNSWTAASGESSWSPETPRPWFERFARSWRTPLGLRLSDARGLVGSWTAQGLRRSTPRSCPCMAGWAHEDADRSPRRSRRSGEEYPGRTTREPASGVRPPDPPCTSGVPPVRSVEAWDFSRARAEPSARAAARLRRWGERLPKQDSAPSPCGVSLRDPLLYVPSHLPPKGRVRRVRPILLPILLRRLGTVGGDVRPIVPSPRRRVLARRAGESASVADRQASERA